MAFAQHQRRPANRFVSSQEYSDQHDEQQQQRLQQNGYQSTSDSDTDWHVISSASSPFLLSETESYASSTRIISDTDSDFEHQNSVAFLPCHDGTGTFLLEDSSTTTSNAEDDPDELKKAMHGLVENGSSGSDVDITLPHGGIAPPSFAMSNPCFTPTAAGLNSQELTNGVSSGEQVNNNTTLVSDEANHDGATRRYHKFAKRQINLDRIPIHHPGSSTSAAILSIVWNNLRRLTSHLLENDTNTVETLSTLMSEAVFEGCMPFSSHLHMEVDNAIRPSSSFFEGNFAI